MHIYMYIHDRPQFMGLSENCVPRRVAGSLPMNERGWGREMSKTQEGVFHEAVKRSGKIKVPEK